MKKITLFLFMFTLMLAWAQDPETNSRNWSVTKLANADQLVSYPNEITYGPDGWLWITERASHNNNENNNGERVVRVDPTNGNKTEMLDLHNDVYSAAGQDGLMGMAIHPDLYADVTTTTNNYVYLAYTYDDAPGGNVARKLRIARYTYDNANNNLDPNSEFVLIDNIDGSNDHNSGRMKIGPDLKIYYTVGDLGWNQFANKCQRIQAQALPTQNDVNNQNWYSYKGKILRMNLDGSIPADNPVFYPFTVTDANPIPDNADTNRPDNEKVRSHIYTYGHRNAQGIIFDSAGKLYSSEHGDRVDDEVNIITPGKNYGWPLIVGQRDAQAYSYCIKASDPNGCTTGSNECPAGSTIHQEDAFPEPVDFQGPIATYVDLPASVPTGDFLTWPTVAPSSIDVYESGIIPWNKNIIVPTLKKGTLYRYELSTDGNSVASELIEFHSSNDRYRDVAFSPDGSTIYAVTDSGGSTSGPSGTTNVGVSNPGAVFKIEYQSFPEPSNQVTAFTATGGAASVNLSWTDASGTNQADGYLIAVSTTPGNFPTLIDGTSLSDDLDLTDGNGVINIKNGVESYLLQNLDEATTYYFEITAYANFGTDVDYLTGTPAPQANAVTEESPKLFITEVVSTGATADRAFVEIYNFGSQPLDLAANNIYLGRERAGGNQFDVALTGTIQPGQYFVAGRSNAQFSSVYGMNPDAEGTDDLFGGDGDDPYILTVGSFVSGGHLTLDIYGEIGVDGTGEAWEYTDSRAVRRREVSQGNVVWTASEWDIITIAAAAETTPKTPETYSFVYDAGNWSPFDPNGLSLLVDNAQVMNGTATLTGAMEINDLTIDAGATLNFAGQQMTLAGNLTNNGDIQALDAILVVDGVTAQNLSGNDFGLATLEVRNAVTVNSTISLYELLTISADLSVDPAHNIVLKSNDQGTAYISEISAGNVTGNFRVEQYVPARRAFRFLTPSVTTSDFISDNWQQDTHITGSNTGANGFDATGTGNASMFGFDNLNGNWTAVANTDATILEAGKAYRLMVRGDRSINVNDNNATPVATTLNATGTILTGPQIVSNLSNTASGFNFVGNPYQAPIDMQLVLAGSTNQNTSFIYLWDPALNARGAYVTVDVTDNTSNNIGSLLNKYVQPGTSFFTQTLTDAAASIAFAEAHKSTDQGILNTARTASVSSLIVSLYEDSEFQNGSGPRDGVVMKYGGQYSNAVTAEDAIKFNNLDETMALVNGTDHLSIEKRQPPADGESTGLNFVRYRGMQYVLQLQLNQLGIGAQLYDAHTQNYTQLNEGVNNYSFTVDPQQAGSNDPERFSILYTNSTLSVNEPVVSGFTLYPNPVEDGVVQLGFGQQTTIQRIELFHSSGQLIGTTKVQNAVDSWSYRLPQGVATGNYFIRVVTDLGSETQQLIVR
ncbi:PQQ-dependent sugar dehydrogenase [Nonlabens xiamenensis]|uniref:PQQ-dependent sugar dehydrogenase n=1 Tax=Nonlabens xiamenensis TaxID=2341043 RepID=UPI0013DE4712|nr:PQQ-dependent sugar dehydrogenase [Nonlabens xiamenensis]